jgi:hypothetical protein
MRILGVIGFPYNGRFVAHSGNMPVKAIFGNVEFAAFKPFDGRIGEIPIEYFIPLFAPHKVLGHPGPKFFGVALAIGIGHIVLIQRTDLIRNRHGAIVFMKDVIIFEAAKVVSLFFLPIYILANLIYLC